MLVLVSNGTFFVIFVVIVIVIIIAIIIIIIIIISGHGTVTVRSRFLGGKDNFLKCLKQLFFGIVYSQKFPIIASIIIYKND